MNVGSQVQFTAHSNISKTGKLGWVVSDECCKVLSAGGNLLRGQATIVNIDHTDGHFAFATLLDNKQTVYFTVSSVQPTITDINKSFQRGQLIYCEAFENQTKNVQYKAKLVCSLANIRKYATVAPKLKTAHKPDSGVPSQSNTKENFQNNEPSTSQPKSAVASPIMPRKNNPKNLPPRPRLAQQNFSNKFDALLVDSSDEESDKLEEEDNKDNEQDGLHVNEEMTPDAEDKQDTPLQTPDPQMHIDKSKNTSGTSTAPALTAGATSSCTLSIQNTALPALTNQHAPGGTVDTVGPSYSNPPEAAAGYSTQAEAASGSQQVMDPSLFSPENPYRAQARQLRGYLQYLKSL